MTSRNGNGDLRQLVLTIAQLLNQSNEQQQAINQQFSDRLSEYTEISNKNVKVAQLERAELRQAQRETSEAVRSVAESVDRLSDEVIPQLAREIADNSSRTASIEAAVERMDRILDYLMRRDRDSNGGQQI